MIDKLRVFLNESRILNDIVGGFSALLVALPSAIAYGLIIFSALGDSYTSKAAMSGILGTIALSTLAPIFGKTAKLVSAPCAPAGAVLSAFVLELISEKNLSLELVPIFVTLTALFAGIMQLLIGKFGGGKLVKYIPYPVVAGYLSGVGILIFAGQVPKFLGIPRGTSFLEGVQNLHEQNLINIVIGTFTIIAMILAIRISKKIPPAIFALSIGGITYFSLAIFKTGLFSLENNPFIIGDISFSFDELFHTTKSNWSSIAKVRLSDIAFLGIPAATLAFLLSIDTLKTCLVLDALTQTRHNSNQELIGQGIGNIFSSLLGGIPGAGTMGPTLVNINSGGKTILSGTFVGIFAMLVLFIFPMILSWIPVAALAGVLIVIGFRMIDWQSFKMLKNRSTIIDFLVILAVIISALTYNLVTAAGTGIGMAILLFLREQIRYSVVRRHFYGNQKFSKKRRLPSEIQILESKGKKTLVLELQGQLFFGTTDQLYTVIEFFLKECKYIILDMRRVQSIDFTAVHMLSQIRNRVQKTGGLLLLSSIPMDLPSGQNIKEYLTHLGISETETLKFFEDMETALEFSEDVLLKEEQELTNNYRKKLLLTEFEFFKGATPRVIKKLEKYLNKKVVGKGELIFHEGDKGYEIFFIRRGSVKIYLNMGMSKNHLITVFSQGDFFGDMAFLNDGIRSANAVADEEVSLYYISKHDFEKIVESAPELGSIFYEKLAFAIAQRLRLTDVELMAMREG